MRNRVPIQKSSNVLPGGSDLNLRCVISETSLGSGRTCKHLPDWPTGRSMSNTDSPNDSFRTPSMKSVFEGAHACVAREFDSSHSKTCNPNSRLSSKSLLPAQPRRWEKVFLTFDSNWNKAASSGEPVHPSSSFYFSYKASIRTCSFFHQVVNGEAFSWSKR